MKLLRCAALAVLLCVGPAWAQQTLQAGQVDGLWAARTRYGPDVRGPLLLTRRDDALIADIAGVQVQARAENGEIFFELPNEQGGFRGRFASGEREIRGHWIQGGTRAGGNLFASPTTLARTRAGQWEGIVAPLDVVMSMYLDIRTDEQGVMRTYIRNPERNIGVFAQVDRIERGGDHLRLITRFRGRGAEQVTAEAEYDHNNDLIPFHFAPFGVTMDFAQADAEDERAFYPRGLAPEPYIYAQPVSLDDGWETGALEEAGIDRAQIGAFIDMLLREPMTNVSAPQIHGLLMARHGRIVLEEYLHGYGRDSVHDTRSASKSITAVLVGAAMQNGASFDTDSFLVDIVDPALLPATIDPRLRQVRLENLMNMAPGFDCDDSDDNSPGNEDAMQQQREEPNWWRFALAVPMARNPGERAIYCSMNANLVGAVLTHEKTDRWAGDLFNEQIARPMQIERYFLNLQPTRDPYLGGGMQLTLRDFAKFGQLALDDGVWNGRRIVPRGYMARATSPLVQLGQNGYGYFWYSSERPYQGRSVTVTWMGGNGGQLVMVVPELDLVIAAFGGNYSDRGTFLMQDDYIPHFILPAVH